MGADCSKVAVQQAPVNPDDQIGTPISIPGGCSPAGSGQTQFASYIPQNGEYEWAGEGATCYYCSADAPNSVSCSAGCADVSCCAIVGTQGTYKRKSYKADPIECCKTGKTMIDNMTCHPSYRNPKSQECYKIVKEYCIQGDNLFTQDVCKSWCAGNPEECVSYEAQDCNKPENFNNGYCKAWCLQHAGMCDTAVEDYCKNDSTADPYCACVKSDIQKYTDSVTKAQYNPICVDRQCIEHGYQTASMLSARGDKCQDIVDCNTYFDIVAGGKVEISDVNIQQRCGSSQTTAPSSSTTPPASTPSSSTAPPANSTQPPSKYSNFIQDNKKLLMGTVGALVVWILILIIIGFIF